MKRKNVAYIENISPQKNKTGNCALCFGGDTCVRVSLVDGLRESRLYLFENVRDDILTLTACRVVVNASRHPYFRFNYEHSHGSSGPYGSPKSRAKRGERGRI